ncbi:MAG: selenocysteine-specific translation elongation factor [Gemmatimonadaceae bacterium]|nr:selenocysteine-specific translation elongation factor [Gemmatimonadaceae bacterium]
MIVGTAGHIDHGKTALVHALTGVDTDRLPEEKRRGITIELGFAPLELPGIGTVGIVDVPGHEAFVRAMVAGATGMDLGLLIVAADEGVMPQTREHLRILTLLDVRTGVVVLTKCDLVERDWIDLVREELRDLVAGTPLDGAPIEETSARTGQGIPELKATIARQLARVSTRAHDDVFRLPVDRAFSVKGTGTVVTGTVWSGRIAVGDELHLFPAGRAVRVRGIQSHGKVAEQSTPGARTAVALAAVDVNEIPRGSVLVGSDAWQPSSRFFAEVSLEAGATPFRAREWLRLHVATSEVSARVVPVADVVASGGGAVARIVPESPLVLRAGDRFVLRRSQELGTIGGGRVIDPAPMRTRRPTQGWRDDAMERLAAVVRDAGPGGLAEPAVSIRVGADAPSRKALESPVSPVVKIDGRIYLKESVTSAEERIEQQVLAHHHLSPTDEGISVAKLRADLGSQGAMVDALLARMATRKRVQVVSGVVKRRGWSPEVSGAAEAEKAWLVERLGAAGMEPPSVSELRTERNRDPLPLLRILEKASAVVAVEPDRYYEAQALAAGLKVLARTMRNGGVYTPSMLREVLGVSRKFLMPLLEYCDRRRITERRGDGRVWLVGGSGGDEA